MVFDYIGGAAGRETGATRSPCGPASCICHRGGRREGLARLWQILRDETSITLAQIGAKFLRRDQLDAWSVS